MTVVERMARAIWEDREQHQNERCRQSWERGSELAWQFAIDHARSALRALCEPSDAMVAAGVMGGDCPHAREQWQAMVSVALAE